MHIILCLRPDWKTGVSWKHVHGIGLDMHSGVDRSSKVGGGGGGGDDLWLQEKHRKYLERQMRGSDLGSDRAGGGCGMSPLPR